MKYKSKLPKKPERGMGYKISSASSIPSKIKKVPVPEVKEKPKSFFNQVLSYFLGWLFVFVHAILRSFAFSIIYSRSSFVSNFYVLSSY